MHLWCNRSIGLRGNLNQKKTIKRANGDSDMSFKNDEQLETFVFLISFLEPGELSSSNIEVPNVLLSLSRLIEGCSST